MAEFMPKFRLGGVAPHAARVTDWAHYQFYYLVPRSVLFVWTGLSPGLAEMTAEAAKEAIRSWDDCVEQLVRRKCDWIELEGVPVSGLLGRDRVLDLIARTQKKTGVSVCSRLESAIAAMQHLGVKNVAIGASWGGQVSEAIAKYLDAVNIRVVAEAGLGQNLAQYSAQTEEQVMRQSLEQGRKVAALAPRADAIWLPGGWIAAHTIVPLEREFGKPVITNFNGTIWNALRRTSVVPPIRGRGKLLAS